MRKLVLFSLFLLASLVVTNVSYSSSTENAKSCKYAELGLVKQHQICVADATQIREAFILQSETEPDYQYQGWCHEPYKSVSTLPAGKNVNNYALLSRFSWRFAKMWTRLSRKAKKTHTGYWRRYHEKLVSGKQKLC